jgi:hypothetical protein
MVTPEGGGSLAATGIAMAVAEVAATRPAGHLAKVPFSFHRACAGSGEHGDRHSFCLMGADRTERCPTYWRYPLMSKSPQQQHTRSIEIELECDEDEAAFDEKLRRIASVKLAITKPPRVKRVAAKPAPRRRYSRIT